MENGEDIKCSHIISTIGLQNTYEDLLSSYNF